MLVAELQVPFASSHLAVVSVPVCTCLYLLICSSTPVKVGVAVDAGGWGGGISHIT